MGLLPRDAVTHDCDGQTPRNTRRPPPSPFTARPGHSQGPAQDTPTAPPRTLPRPRPGHSHGPAQDTHPRPRWRTSRAAGPRRAGPRRPPACGPASRARRWSRSPAWTCAAPDAVVVLLPCAQSPAQPRAAGLSPADLREVRASSPSQPGTREGLSTASSDTSLTRPHGGACAAARGTRGREGGAEPRPLQRASVSRFTGSMKALCWRPHFLLKGWKSDSSTTAQSHTHPRLQGTLHRLCLLQRHRVLCS